MWCFPGGRIEVNEEYKRATEREVEEETGKEILINNINLKNDYFFMYNIYYMNKIRTKSFIP
jgi:ADP-ribose pyrophosphatase YjhB (NUDIX family)